MTTTFILASSSPRRRELLASLGITFTIIKPDIDETQQPGEAPLDYVARLSQQKAAHVATRLHSDAAILAADTVVILGADTLGIAGTGDILGKPTDADDARAMLRRLRGRVHQVCTAVTLHPLNPTAAPRTRITRTDVTMRGYSDAEIDAYIATGDPFDKAGSYAIQHSIFRPVARIDGCYTNVVGLPLCTLKTLLAESGWPGIQAAPSCDCEPIANG
ncbi:MAG: septum formation protein Maf [Anaerolineae bacterium]|nr:septum formation protein Maf [Anaerolineae bacterium]